jgi:NADH:ubiquinone reductase (H+-translocating)
MPLLPFYIPRHKQLRIVIVGGGYAGVAALVTLLRYMPEARITIIDPKSNHLKITHLHETFRYPLQDFLIPFSLLEDRFGCRHICAKLSIDEHSLRQWQTDKFIAVGDEIANFDYVLVALGMPSVQATKPGNVFDLQDFMISPGSSLLDNELQGCNKSEQFISVVGGGATGIQFLFEIAYFLRRRNSKCKLRLIHGQNRVLQQFPEEFSDYTQAHMAELDVEFYPNTRYREQETGDVALENAETGRIFRLASSMSLLFLGKRPEILLSANAFGQVMIEHESLQNIFTSGDCSIYNSSGSNTMTAQSAVRKGMLAARNILRHSGFPGLLEPYWHRDLGYVVSLGPSDAVGWLALEDNVVGGVPALLIKEIVEAQYDLLLTGIDTYLI